MNVQLVADVTQWLVSPGSRREQTPEEVLDQLLAQLTAGGVPLWRASTSLLTMHPEVEGIEVVWQRDRGTHTRAVPHDVLDTAEYQGSPIEEVTRTRVQLRCRLDAGATPYPQLETLRQAGATDYLATPVEMGNGRISCFTYTTDAPGGFTDEHVQTLDALTPILSLRFDLGVMRHSLHSLLDVYLGKSAARQVLTGSFRRGAGHLLGAAIWFSDMRGFTSFSD